MREILFHAKEKDTGNWVEGFYVKLYDYKGHESHRIYPGYAGTDCGEYYPDWYEVDPDTVSEFTSLTDKNGKRIFEGDIVTTGHGLLWTIGFDLNAFVALDGRTVQFALFEQYEWNHKTKEPIAPDYFEIIGNIHDNPELIGEREE